MPDPAALYQVGIPRDQTPARSEEIRNNFQALLQNLFTSDPALPLNAPDYAIRLLDDVNDPIQAGNLRLQVRFGGAWRDILQNLQGGLAAPAKSLLDFVQGGPSSPWVIDHNLGSQPMVQVIGTTGPQYTLFTPANDTAQRREVRFLGRVPTAGVAAGVVRAGLTLPYNGTIIRTFAVSEGVLSAPVDLTFQFTRNATALTPEGDITVNAALVRGDEVAGAGLPTQANFEAGDTLDIDLVVNTAPGDGALELYAELERTMGATEYRLTHINANRLQIEFAAPTQGFAILVG